MTKDELSQVYYIGKEIELMEVRLVELESKLNNTRTVDVVEGSDKEPPYQKRNHVVSGFPCSAQANHYRNLLYRQKVLIADKKLELEEKRAEILAWIYGIEDSLTRQVVGLRYLGLSEEQKKKVGKEHEIVPIPTPWEVVASAIGGDNTGEGVRKRCNRHLGI